MNNRKSHKYHFLSVFIFILIFCFFSCGTGLPDIYKYDNSFTWEFKIIEVPGGTAPCNVALALKMPSSEGSETKLSISNFEVFHNGKSILQKKDFLQTIEKNSWTNESGENESNYQTIFFCLPENFSGSIKTDDIFKVIFQCKSDRKITGSMTSWLFDNGNNGWKDIAEIIKKDPTQEFDDLPSELRNISFEGKDYEIQVNDDFENEFYADSWCPGCSYWVSEEFSSAGALDGSWLGSKIYGAEKFEKIILEPLKGTTAMGEEVFYTKDGVLHCKSIREKQGNDWHIFLPAFQTRKIFERGMLVEIRYKMPVKGKDSVYHMCLQTQSSADFNEQGWTFKQLFLSETLSAVPNKIRYSPSMWFGKYNKDKSESNIDNAIADYDRETDKYTDYSVDQNAHDDVETGFPLIDENFYEWHTAKAVYDDERFAVYQDTDTGNEKVYEWKWSEHPECGMPQDYKKNGKVLAKGGVTFVVSMGLAGDWAVFFNTADWAGEFDESAREYDMQIDYIRVYKQK